MSLRKIWNVFQNYHFDTGWWIGELWVAFCYFHIFFSITSNVMKAHRYVFGKHYFWNTVIRNGFFKFYIQIAFKVLYILSLFLYRSCVIFFYFLGSTKTVVLVICGILQLMSAKVSLNTSWLIWLKIKNRNNLRCTTIWERLKNSFKQQFLEPFCIDYTFF